MNSNYRKYLESPQWLSKRAAKLAEAGNRCQLCNSTDRLEVHHRTYDTIFREPLNDLTVLCNQCHSYFHHVKNVDEDEYLRKCKAETRYYSPNHLNYCFTLSDIISLLKCNADTREEALELVNDYFEWLPPEHWRYDKLKVKSRENG